MRRGEAGAAATRRRQVAAVARSGGKVAAVNASAEGGQGLLTGIVAKEGNKFMFASKS